MPQSDRIKIVLDVAAALIRDTDRKELVELLGEDAYKVAKSLIEREDDRNESESTETGR